MKAKQRLVVYVVILLITANSNAFGQDEAARTTAANAALFATRDATAPHDRCAAAVREAWAKADVIIKAFPAAEKDQAKAKNYGPKYRDAGFEKVYSVEEGTELVSSEKPGAFKLLVGDVVIMQPLREGTGPAGHMAIYNGEHWVADYIHPIPNDPYPGPYRRKKKPALEIWRFVGGAARRKADAQERVDNALKEALNGVAKDRQELTQEIQRESNVMADAAAAKEAFDRASEGIKAELKKKQLERASWLVNEMRAMIGEIETSNQTEYEMEANAQALSEVYPDGNAYDVVYNAGTRWVEVCGIPKAQADQLVANGKLITADGFQHHNAITKAYVPQSPVQVGSRTIPSPR